MNNRRADTISSLLLVVLVVIVIVGFARFLMVGRQIDKVYAEDAKMVIGTDPELAQAVSDLETTLNERISYQFTSKNDPMDLTKAITSDAFIEKIGANKYDANRAEMRLAATVVGANEATAAIIIRYLGSNHVLRMGDKIDGWKVVSIDERAAVLVRGGERKVLHNRPERGKKGASGNVLSVVPTDR